MLSENPTDMDIFASLMVFSVKK